MADRCSNLIWAALMALIMLMGRAAVDAEGSCVRLDDDTAPAQFSHALGRYLPVEFAVERTDTGALHLRFMDNSTLVVMAFDEEQSTRLAQRIDRLLSRPRSDETDGEITFTGWFRLGPTWHHTGAAQGRAVVAISQSAADTPYRFDFDGLASQQAKYITYEPSDLHFSAALLRQVGALAQDAETELVQGTPRPCGEESLPVAMFRP